MPSINNAYVWCINVCNAPNIGYSQSYREGEKVNGVTYYDCSSLMYYALKAGGFDVVGAFGKSAFTTANMQPVLIALGFHVVDKNGVLLPGDIGVSANDHTEMCYQGGIGEGIFMGAHTNNAKLDNQVCIGSSSGNATAKTSGSRWDNVYRYENGATGGITYQWVNENNSAYFGDPTGTLCGNDERAKNNACCILQYFYAKGWSLEAISALCGNIQQESTFNPSLIEHGGTGHGLVQWTPPSDLYNVLDVLYGSHADWNDPVKQLEVIWAEYEQYTGTQHRGIDKQWYTEEPPYRGDEAHKMRWDEWASSHEDPGFLASVFEYCYLRPANHHPEREQFARDWYEYLKTIDPSGGGGYGTKKRVGMPVYMYNIRRLRWR